MKLQSLVLEAVPSDIPHPLRVDFEGKVRLLGYDITHSAGGAELILYWQSLERLPKGWRLFTHLVDGQGQQVPFPNGNFDHVGPLRELSPEGSVALPPSRWIPGKVYVDRQTIKTPSGVLLPVSIVVGVWNGPHRLQVTSGNSDRSNQAVVTQLQSS